MALLSGGQESVELAQVWRWHPDVTHRLGLVLLFQ
jgi:hypothetical protein